MLNRSSVRTSRHAALAWAAFVFILLSLPGSSVPRFSFSLVGIPSDALVHAALFAVLMVLLARAWRLGALPHPSPSPSRGQALAAAFTTSLCYGALTELWQHLVPGRSGDVMDIVADGAGAVLGFLMLSAPPLRRLLPG
jgi:hypothetical protein